MVNSTGDLNVALGFAAGVNLATGNNNIDVGNVGMRRETNAIRIGAQIAVTDQFGVLHPAHTATYIAGMRHYDGNRRRVTSVNRLRRPARDDEFITPL